MKATISKNYKFIQLNFPVDRTDIHGLKVFYKYETEKDMPIAETPFIKGKKRYSLRGLPKEARESIYAMEIKLRENWEKVELKNNNSGVEK